MYIVARQQWPTVVADSAAERLVLPPPGGQVLQVVGTAVAHLGELDRQRLRITVLRIIPVNSSARSNAVARPGTPARMRFNAARPASPSRANGHRKANDSLRTDAAAGFSALAVCRISAGCRANNRSTASRRFLSRCQRSATCLACGAASVAALANAVQRSWAITSICGCTRFFYMVCATSMCYIATVTDCFGTLTSTYRGKPDGDGRPGLLVDGRVRGLMPVEAERLQGFPDGWTQGIPTSQRYRCLGNAVCVPVVRALVRQLG